MSPRRTGNVTLADVARASGFSRSVASRALLNQPGVSAATRQAILDTAKRLNYVPNQPARALVGGHTRTLGLVTRGTTSPFYGALADVFYEAAANEDYRVVIINAGSDPRGSADAIRHLVALNVDGLVLASSIIPEQTALDFNRRIPTVVVGRGRLDNCAISRVSVAADAPSYIVNALANAGHTHLGLLHVPHSASPTQFERAGVALTAARQLHLEVTESSIPLSGIASGISKLLAAGATAFMCGNDHVAFDAISNLRERGVDIPSDISVVGFDGLGPYAHPLIGLTTYKIPVKEMAREVIDIILRHLKNPNAKREHIEIPGILIPGNTAIISDERSII